MSEILTPYASAVIADLERQLAEAHKYIVKAHEIMLKSKGETMAIDLMAVAWLLATEDIYFNRLKGGKKQ